MVEFKLQLEDNFVETFGHLEIEKQLQEFKKKIVLKLAAKDILKDYKNENIENDLEWQLNRKNVWEQEKSKYFS
ncbi:MAG: hypothetical protein EAZ53_11270 [Bacteroidetes bacterium]|nr:MAG: hypothetical protein EAZ53_11270 [Bacteroidota bacterium]